MTEKSLVRSERGPEGNYDLLEPEAGVPEIYVDGFVGISFSVSTIKLDLYSSTGIEHIEGKQIDRRELKLRLVMPTGNFLELCKKSLQTMPSNKESIDIAIQQYSDQLRNYFTTVKPAESKKET